MKTKKLFRKAILPGTIIAGALSPVLVSKMAENLPPAELNTRTQNITEAFYNSVALNSEAQNRAYQKAEAVNNAIYKSISGFSFSMRGRSDAQRNLLGGDFENRTHFATLLVEGLEAPSFTLTEESNSLLKLPLEGSVEDSAEQALQLLSAAYDHLQVADRHGTITAAGEYTLTEDGQVMFVPAQDHTHITQNPSLPGI